MAFTIEYFNNLSGLISFGHSRGARYWFIVAVSLISAFVFLYLFKLISSQRRIKKYKNMIWGNILNMRLYQDSLRVISLSILKVAGYNLLYLKEMLLPMIVLLPALAIFTMMVNNRCGYQPLNFGEEAIVRVVLPSGAGNDEFDSLQRVRLETEGGIELRTPALRVPDERAVYWRAAVTDNGGGAFIRVGTGEGSPPVRRQVALSGFAPKSFAPVLCRWNWEQGLIHNAEGFLAVDAGIESIRVGYKRQQYPLLWWETDSLVVYFVLVLVFALAFKPIFRVTL